MGNLVLQARHKVRMKRDVMSGKEFTHSIAAGMLSQLGYWRYQSDCKVWTSYNTLHIPPSPHGWFMKTAILRASVLPEHVVMCLCGTFCVRVWKGGGGGGYLPAN